MRVALLFLFLWPSLALAQTLTTDLPPEQKAWEVFLKVLFPPLWMSLSPMLLRWLETGPAKWAATLPPSVQVVISSIIGALAAGFAGLIPDFPLTPESAATMGAASGATGQLLLRATPTPKKEG